ncbi:unnamed protein product [Rotaria sordida]|uniref:EF-hand domain-containing protein n=1 Tax=Rotaria sordida TaxID=392033 RepID=A0A818TT97_9BILA|nr:unnamed protein product [Rotaria sordida]CAF1342752.1 unnamed protein product [Rotaria sordida]CAF3683626.1 unnamed protein product [Rotaria sordida]
MARVFLIATCIVLLMIGSFADKEYETHGHDHHHHHDHDGHDHHDHESHKKLFTGEDMDGSESEQHEKLRQVAKQIDTDQDGQISYDEMRSYTGERVQEQNNREADELIATLDPKQTKKITFDAYVRDSFGDFDINQLAMSDKPDPSTRETRRLYKVDKQKWEYLDTDGDQSLSYDEFRRFLRPEDDEELGKIEINSMINEYDQDNDGKLSNPEYLKMTEAETGQAESLSRELDVNNDGFGDFQEFTNYYLPSLVSTVDQETEHLLKECDTDKNGYCTPDEIVQAYSSFAGSQITDFGADLEKSKEEL